MTRYYRPVPDHPIAFLITFRCYGTWLHGDERGSTDPAHRGFGDDRTQRDDWRVAFERRELRHAPVALDDHRRALVARTIAEVCRHRRWGLLAQNVRTNHVHVLVSAVGEPELVLNALKSWCTRRLRETGLCAPGQRMWSRHGSTVYVWTEEQLTRCRSYVVDGQDEGPQP